jgi:hypothetical protein
MTYCKIPHKTGEGGGPKAPTAIYGSSGPIFYQIDKANIIVDCLENQFRTHYLCDCDHKQYVEAKVEVLMAIINETPLLISETVTSQKI